MNERYSAKNTRQSASLGQVICIILVLTVFASLFYRIFLSPVKPPQAITGDRAIPSVSYADNLNKLFPPLVAHSFRCSTNEALLKQRVDAKNASALRPCLTGALRGTLQGETFTPTFSVGTSGRATTVKKESKTAATVTFSATDPVIGLIIRDETTNGQSNPTWTDWFWYGAYNELLVAKDQRRTDVIVIFGPPLATTAQPSNVLDSITNNAGLNWSTIVSEMQ